MKINNKYYKTLVWNGKIETVECTKHFYRYSGKMPCTGNKVCIHCGKIENIN